MLQQIRHGQEHSKRGNTLIEVTAAIAIMVIVYSIVMGGYQTRINKAKLERTINEMMALAQASLDFYHSQRTWPASPNNLSPAFMYVAVAFSPFGGNYQINGLNNMVTVATTIPSGLAQNYYQGALLEILPGIPNDTISVTQRQPNEFSGRLQYDKKYTYQQ